MAAHVKSPAPSSRGPLAFLDRLLSEPLRSAPPEELVRYRIMACASLFLFVSCLLYLATVPPWPNLVSTAVAALGYLSTLLLLRRAQSPRLPAWMLCLAVAQGFTGVVFLGHSPIESVHAAIMLLPALAVYLMRPRAGLALTGLLWWRWGCSFRSITGSPPPPRSSCSPSNCGR